jgi:uncharacterized protein
LLSEAFAAGVPSAPPPRPPTVPALGVMMRVPGREAVKTRLHAALGPGAATLLYRCLVLDMLGVAARVPGVVPVAAFSPVGAGSAMAGLVPGGMRCLAQRGDDLGARMANLIADLLAAGHPAVLVTGSDLPTVPIEYLAEAARVLSGGGADVVLGPAEDGGYYLVGLRRPAPELFVDVAWGTAAVLEVTLARARALGLRAYLLSEWHDVDTVDDVARLRRDLAGAGATPPEGAWRTRRWLAAFPPPPNP